MYCGSSNNWKLWLQIIAQSHAYFQRWHQYVSDLAPLNIKFCSLRFSQPLQTVTGHFLCQQINWKGIWYVIYGWKDLPVRNNFWSSIQWISPWKYKQIKKTIFSPQNAEKNRWRCVKQYCVIIYLWNRSHVQIQIIS